MIYLITPTGNRFIQFSFCVDLMKQQDFTDDVTWVISDDGIAHQPTPVVKNWNIIHNKLKPPKNKKINTQGTNIYNCLKYCNPNSKILIIEDDDFYCKQWLSIVCEKLDKFGLVGEKMAKYYSLSTRTYTQFQNDKHASLCSTGFNDPNVFYLLQELSLKNLQFIDMPLWFNAKSKKKLFRGNYTIGFKGWNIGRKGLGHGHKSRFKHVDFSLNILNSWVGKNKEWFDKYKNIVMISSLKNYD